MAWIEKFLDFASPGVLSFFSNLAAQRLPWEEDESAVLKNTKGGLKKARTSDSVWSFSDLLSVSFHETVQCVLIPSRHDYREQGLVEQLWYSADEIKAATDEASEELLMTVPTNVSTMSLYAAMNLLYRPCSMKGKLSHFNILIVDDSVVARKMITLHLVQQHKQSGIRETIYVHHADSYHGALQMIKRKTFNVVIIDHILSASPDASLHASVLNRHGRDALPHRQMSKPKKSALKGGSRESTDTATDDGASLSRSRGAVNSSRTGSVGIHDTWSDRRSDLRAFPAEGDGGEGSISECSSLMHSECSGSTNECKQSTDGPGAESRRRRKASTDSQAGTEDNSLLMSYWTDVATENGSSCESNTNSPFDGFPQNSGSNITTPDRSVRSNLADPLSYAPNEQEKVSALDKHRTRYTSEDDKGSTSSVCTDFVQSSDGVTTKSLDSTRIHAEDGLQYASTTPPRSTQSATGTSRESFSDINMDSSVEDMTKNCVTAYPSRDSLVVPQPHRHRRSNSFHKSPAIEWKQMTGLVHRKTDDESESTTSSSASNDRVDGSSHTSRNKGLPTAQSRELTSTNPRQLTRSAESRTNDSCANGNKNSLGLSHSRSNLASFMQEFSNGSELSHASGESEVREASPRSLHSFEDDDQSGYLMASCSAEGIGKDLQSLRKRDGMLLEPSLSCEKGFIHSGSDLDNPITTSYDARPVGEQTRTDTLGNLRPSDTAQVDSVVKKGLGLAGKTKNSFNEIPRLNKMKSKTKDCPAEHLSSQNAFSSAREHSELRMSDAIDEEHVIVGIEGKLNSSQSWEASAGTSEVHLDKSYRTKTDQNAEGPLRMSDLYSSRKEGASTGDLSVNSSSSLDSKNIFESFKEPKIKMIDVDPGAWNGKDIIEVIREDTPCLIIGISNLIISDYDEAYDEGTHTVNAIRMSNNLRADFFRAGADLVWPKPVPKDAWQQLYDVMPLEF